MYVFMFHLKEKKLAKKNKQFIVLIEKIIRF